MTDRTIMAGLGLLVALASLTSVWPVLDAVFVVFVVVGAGATLAGYWLREVGRELRFRRDMRALDARHALRANRMDVVGVTVAGIDQRCKEH